MMIPLLKTLTSFGLVSGAAFSNGKLARSLKLPVITGFLLTGILAGPSVLGFISASEVTTLQPLDHIALGMIAITAGSELSLRALKGRWGAILCTMFGLVGVTLTIGAGLTYLSRGFIPFLSELDPMNTLAACFLIGTIMVARSPSAAIAIMRELRAHGPFTQLVLGVTVLMDVVVILLFALMLSLAHSLIDGQGSLMHLGVEVGLEIGLSIGLGVLFALLLGSCLRAQRGAWMRPLSVVAISCLIFFIAAELHHVGLTWLGAPIHIEPLLSCLVVGAMLNNVGERGEELEYELSRLAPLVYVSFFTITGASLNLELLALVWPAAILLFVIRLLGIGLGSVFGGMLAGEPREQHSYRWMGFVTQAGVGLGLAERVSHEFPLWGERFAVLMIAVIVLNEMVGPLFFKRAVIRSGEARCSDEEQERAQDQERAQYQERAQDQERALVISAEPLKSAETISLNSIASSHATQAETSARFTPVNLEM